jgi:hypothetical protein
MEGQGFTGCPVQAPDLQEATNMDQPQEHQEVSAIFLVTCLALHPLLSEFPPQSGLQQLGLSHAFLVSDT